MSPTLHRHWPLVVLFVPRWMIGGIIWSAVLLAPLSRILIALLVPNSMAWYYATPGAFDCLGLGAIAAMRRRDGRRFGFVPVSIPVLLLLVMAALRVAMLGWKLVIIAEPVSCGLVAVAIIERLVSAPHCSRAGILAWRPLIRLGMVSYGLYVYHLLILRLLVLGHAPLPDGLARPVLLGALTFVVAWLSWTCVERPINSLKRLFPYVAPC